MMRKTLLPSMLLLSLTACQNTNTQSLKTTTVLQNDLPTTTSTDKYTNNITGDYVTDGYTKRNEGYDWFAISVRDAGQDAISVSIRSRIDKKKPTCTLDTVLHKAHDGRYQFWVDNNPVYLRFDDNSLSIEGEEAYLQKTAFYCSGGATLGGVYQKLSDTLDTQQLDNSQYATSLNYGDFSTQVTSTSDGNGGYILQIQPMGEDIIERPISDPVVSADVGDMNGDGYPEILVFTQSVGSGSYGDVIAYSSNKGLSWSEVSYPELTDTLKQGYMGHDAFALVENVLVRRFPLYLEDDSNAKPQGKTRQIQYRMIEGEASRQFVIDTINEF